MSKEFNFKQESPTAKEIFPKLMEGRYANARGGALISWIQESNPDLSPEVYTRLMNAVEAQRTKFAFSQQKLIDVKSYF
jgi:hypothetical protein